MKKITITKNIITTRAILYQILGYGILLFLIVGDEVFDFPHTVFGYPATPINWIEVMIESFYIVVFCIISVYTNFRFLKKIKFLEGLLPICSHCKKIRDGKDWKSFEEYISDHSEALFSHGVCPECLEKYYSEFIDDDKIQPLRRGTKDKS
ncbi:MAG: hypothetical protein WA610_06190 [Thermodesulfovibrionales bacterium]